MEKLSKFQMTISPDPMDSPACSFQPLLGAGRTRAASGAGTAGRAAGSLNLCTSAGER